MAQQPATVKPADRQHDVGQPNSFKIGGPSALVPEGFALQKLTGIGCYLETKEDPRSLGHDYEKADAAALACADSVIKKEYETPSQEGNSHLLAFPESSACSLSKALGVAEDFDPEQWMKTAEAALSLGGQALRGLMQFTPTSLKTDLFTAGLAKSFGPKISRMTDNQIETLSYCLFLERHRVVSDHDPNDYKVAYRFERAVERYLNQEREKRAAKALPSWEEILADPKKMAEKAPKSLVCTEGKKDSLADAFLFREHFLSDTYRKRVELWRAANKEIGEGIPESYDSKYLADLRLKLCLLKDADQTNPKTFTDSLAKAQKFLTAQGHSPAPWVTQLLLENVAGTKDKASLANFLAHGIPLNPSTAVADLEALNACPGLEGKIREQTLLEFTKFLRPMRPDHFTQQKLAEEEAAKQASAPKLDERRAVTISETWQVSQALQLWLAKTATITKLVNNGFLCSGTDKTADSAKVTQDAVRSLFASSKEAHEAFSKTLAEAKPASHEFLPTKPGFIRKGEIYPYCLLPIGQDQRFFLSGTLPGATQRQRTLVELDEILFSPDLSKVSALEKSFLWNTSGRHGANSSQPVKMPEKLSWFKSGTVAGHSLGWDLLFQDTTLFNQLRQAVFPPEANGHYTDASLNRLRQTEFPILAAAIARESLLLEAEAERVAEVSKGSPLYAGSEKKALTVLRAQFCKELRRGDGAASERANDLAKFSAALFQLTPKGPDGKSGKPVAMNEGLIQLFLSLDSVHRDQLNQVFKQEACLVKNPQIADSLLNEVLAKAPSVTAPVRNRTLWFSELKKHFVVCEVLEALAERAKKAKSKTAIAEVESKIGRSLTNSTNPADPLFKKMMASTLDEVQAVLGDLKSLPNDFGTVVVTREKVKDPSTQQATEKALVNIDLPSSQVQLLTALPLGPTSEGTSKAMLDHLTRVEILLGQLSNPGLTRGTHYAEAAKLMNAAWKSSFGSELLPLPEYLKPPFDGNTRGVSLMARYSQSPEAISNASMSAGYMEVHWYPKLSGDGDYEKAKKLFESMLAARVGMRSLPSQRARDGLSYTQLPKGESAKDFLQGLAAHKTEIDKVLEPLFKKAKEGHLDAEQLAKFAETVQENFETFQHLLLDLVDEKIQPISPAQYKEAMAFLRLRKLAVAAITQGVAPPPATPSDEVKKNPKLEEIFRRGQEYLAANEEIRRQLQGNGGKGLPAAPQQLLQDLLREQKLMHGTREHLLGEVRSGNISAETVGNSLGVFNGALRDMEETLIAAIMKDRPIPTAKSHPEYSRVLLRYPSNSGETNIPLEIVNVPLSVLGKYRETWEGVFEHMRNSKCDGHEEIRDRLDSVASSLRYSSFSSDAQNASTDGEAQLRMSQWICWAAKTCGPIGGHNVVDLQSQCDSYKDTIVEIKKYLDHPKVIFFVPESDPHLKRVEPLMRRLLDESGYSSTFEKELRQLKLSEDPNDRAVFRKVASFGLQLPEHWAGRRSLVRALIPPQIDACVNEAYTLAARSPSSGIKAEEIQEFEKLLPQAPSHWISHQTARSIADSAYRPRFRDLYDTLKQEVEEYRRAADPVPFPDLKREKPIVASTDQISMAHAKFLQDIVALAIPAFNSKGKANLGVLNALQLPFEEVHKLFEEVEILGGGDLALQQARNYLMVERGLLHATLSQPKATVWLSPFGHSLYAKDAKQLELGQGKEFARATLTKDSEASLKEVDTAMGILIGLIDRHLNQRFHERNPDRASFGQFAENARNGPAELQRWTDYIVGQKELVHTNEQIDHLRTSLPTLLLPMKRDQVATRQKIEMVDPYDPTDTTLDVRRRYYNDGWWGSEREKIPKVANVASSTRPPVSYLGALETHNGLKSLQVFGSISDMDLAKDLRAERAKSTQQLLNSILGLGKLYPNLKHPITFREDLRREERIYEENRKNRRQDVRYRADAVLEHKKLEEELKQKTQKFYASDRYQGISPEASETWQQLPPFLRHQLDSFLTGAGANVDLSAPEFQKIRSQLVEPWPGRTVEFFRTTKDVIAGWEEGKKFSFCRRHVEQMKSLALRTVMPSGEKEPTIHDRILEFSKKELVEVCDDRVAVLENLRSRALGLLFTLYKDHPLVKEAAKLKAEDWLQEPPAEPIRLLKIALTTAIDDEKRALGGKPIEKLSPLDLEKQILLMAILGAEEVGNKASGDAALALEQAKGGMDRFSPIFSAFYAGLDLHLNSSKSTGKEIISAQLLPGLRVVHTENEEKESNQDPVLSSPTEPKLGYGLSAKQRLPIAALDEAETKEFRSLYAHILGNDALKDSPKGRGVLRSVQLGVGSLERLKKSFDPTEEFNKRRQTEAYADSVAKSNEIVTQLAERKPLTAAMLKRIAEEAMAAWVMDGVQRNPPVLRLRAEITSEALGYARDSVMAEYQRRAGEKLFESRLGKPNITELFRLPAEDRTARQLAMMNFLHRAGMGEPDVFGTTEPPPDWLVGPKGLFKDSHDAKEFASSVRSLLGPSVRLKEAHREVPRENADDIEKQGVVDALQTQFATLSLDHGNGKTEAHPPAHATQNGPKDEGNLAPPDWSGLVDRCRAMEFSAFGQARTAINPVKDQSFEKTRILLVEKSEEMRLLQRSIRKWRHLVYLADSRIPGLKDSLEKATDLNNEGNKEHPFYLSDAIRKKMADQIQKLEDEKSKATTALRNQERLFTALMTEVSKISQQAAQPATDKIASLEDPDKAVEKAVDAAKADCIKAYADARLQSARRLGFNSLTPAEFSDKEWIKAYRFLDLIKRLRQAATEKVRKGDTSDAIPPEVEALINAGGEGLGIGRMSPQEMLAFYKKEERGARKFLIDQKAALKELGELGLTREALTSEPPDFSKFKISGGDLVGQLKIKLMLRKASRFLQGTPFGQAFPEENWEKHPLADALWDKFRGQVFKQWASQGRNAAFPINEFSAAHVKYSKTEKDFFIVFENLKGAQAAGQAAVDGAQLILSDKERFVDLRASGNHLFDWAGTHNTQAKGDIDGKMQNLHAYLDVMDSLEGLSFKLDGQKHSGAYIAAHIHAEKELGIRAELTETLVNMDSDFRWKCASVALMAGTVALTIASAGAASPLLAVFSAPTVIAINAGAHGAMMVNGLHLLGYGVNDAAYAAGSTWFYDKNKNFTDSGKANAISSVLFFVGSGLGSYALGAAGRAAAVTSNARAAGRSMEEVANAVGKVNQAIAAGESVEGSAAVKVLMEVTGKLTTESALAEASLAVGMRGALLTRLAAHSTATNMGILYSTNVLGHTGFDYVDSEINGTSYKFWDQLKKHSVEEISTALFAAGGDRWIADKFKPFVVKAFGRGFDLSYLAKVGTAGSVNVGISILGGGLGEEMAEHQQTAQLEKLLLLPTDSVRDRDKQYSEVVNLLEGKEKMKKLAEEGVAREWLHRALIDVGMFARKASNASYKAQSAARAKARIEAGIDKKIAYERMLVEVKPSLIERMENPLTRFFPQLNHGPKPAEFAFEAEGGVHLLKLLKDLPASDKKGKAILEMELDKLLARLNGQGNTTIKRGDLLQFLDVFASDPQLSQQPMLILTDKEFLGADKRIETRKVYAGTVTNFESWARAEISRQKTEVPRKLREGTADQATIDKAIHDERDAWTEHLQNNANFVKGMPLTLLTSRGGNDFRKAVVKALVATQGESDPKIEARMELALNKFIEAVIPRTKNQPPHDAVVGDLFSEFKNAGPKDTEGPLIWMAKMRNEGIRMGIKEYQEIYGVGGYVRDVVIVRTLQWDREQGAGSKLTEADMRPFAEFVAGKWKENGPPQAFTEQGWRERYLSFRGSRPKPKTN